jgi:hypothetical protein
MTEQLEIERFEGEGAPPLDVDVRQSTAPPVVRRPRHVFKTGDIVTSAHYVWDRYVVTVHENGRKSLRREVPKVRGKAARRAEKAARRCARGARA